MHFAVFPKERSATLVLPALRTFSEPVQILKFQRLRVGTVFGSAWNGDAWRWVVRDICCGPSHRARRMR